MLVSCKWPKTVNTTALTKHLPQTQYGDADIYKHFKTFTGTMNLLTARRQPSRGPHTLIPMQSSFLMQELVRVFIFFSVLLSVKICNTFFLLLYFLFILDYIYLCGTVRPCNNLLSYTLFSVSTDDKSTLKYKTVEI